MFNLYSLTRGLGIPATLLQAKNWNYSTGKGICPPGFESFLPLQTQSWTCNWPFAGLRLRDICLSFQTQESAFSSSHCPIWKHWCVTVMDHLPKGLGKWVRARRMKDRLHHRCRCILCPLQPLHVPCPEPGTSQWRGPGTCLGHTIKKGEARTLCPSFPNYFSPGKHSR